jgi:hypothetical protein
VASFVEEYKRTITAFEDTILVVTQSPIGAAPGTQRTHVIAWLRVEHPDQRRWHVCHETIYQAVYNPARGGLSRELTKKLRRWYGLSGQ